MEFSIISYDYVLSNRTLRSIVLDPLWDRCHQVAQGCDITIKDHNRATHQVMATNILKRLIDKSYNLREEYRLSLLSRILTHDIGHAFPTSHAVEYYKRDIIDKYCFMIDLIKIPLWNLNHEDIGRLITKELYQRINYSEIYNPLTHEEKVANRLIESNEVDADRIAYIYYDSYVYNLDSKYKPCTFTIEEAVESFDPKIGFRDEFINKLLDYRGYLYKEIYPNQPTLDLSRYHLQLINAHKNIENFCNHWCKLEDLKN